MDEKVPNHPKIINQWLKVLSMQLYGPVSARVAWRDGGWHHEVVGYLPDKGMPIIDAIYTASWKKLSGLDPVGVSDLEVYANTNITSYQNNIPLIFADQEDDAAQFAYLIQRVYDKYSPLFKEPITDYSNDGLAKLLINICRTTTKIPSQEVVFPVELETR